MRALLGVLLAIAAARASAQCVGEPVEHVVAPRATDPAIDIVIGDHYAYVQPGLPMRDELVVWFPGSCGIARVYRGVLREAARAGFRALGLDYANCPPVNALCDPYQPGDPDCYEHVRLERLDGVDRTPLVSVSPANGIENRLQKLLAYLDAGFPAEGWGRYLEGGSIRWDRLVVAGHSQGAGVAAIIAKRYLVARVAMFSWVDNSTLLELAPWMSAPGITPVERWYGLSHLRFWPGQEALGWDALGLPGATVNVDATAEPYGNANRLVTDVLPQSGSYAQAHAAVATDYQTPLRADGTPVLSEVWRYLLGATPTVVAPIRATKLALRDGSATGDPGRRRIAFTARTTRADDANRIVPPAPGGPGDPRVAGAVLDVFNAAAGFETARVALPPSGWRLLGTDTNPKGWAYAGSDAGAPVRKVVVKPDALDVRGGEDAWCYSLDEPAQGRVGLRLALGDGAEWCADVPPEPDGMQLAPGRNDTVDQFVGARDTPPPAACPLAPRAP